MFVGGAAAPYVRQAAVKGVQAAQNAYVYGTVAAGTPAGQRALEIGMDAISGIFDGPPSAPKTYIGGGIGIVSNLAKKVNW